MNSFDVEKFRQQFPLLGNNSQSIKRHAHEQTNPTQEVSNAFVYLDNGATTQKPNCVIDSHQTFYQEYNANVHRASHVLSAKATAAFEQARDNVKDYINAKSIKEIIWTKGATEGFNLIANTLAHHILSPGDEIIISVSEHHANIVPWQLLAKQSSAIIKVLGLDEDGRIDLNGFEKLINNKTKIVCCAQVSNVLGKVNPIEAIIAQAKAVGAITIIDGAQAVAHFPVDVQALDCDFYLFSAHKMYGPTGVGVLYGKQALLESMPPYQAGGEMIKKVSFNQPTIFADLPFKFEAGTPNIAGVIAFAQAIQFIKQFSHSAIMKHEGVLIQHCSRALAQMPNINFFVNNVPDIPVLAFTVEGHHNHDIASALDSFGIAIRSGHHCAMPLMEYLSLSGCLRVSMAAYNTIEEIDYFIACLEKIITGVDRNIVVNDVSAKKNLQQRRQLNSDDIIKQFIHIAGWHNRHREIMLLSKKLRRLTNSDRSEQALIHGCESLAWLVATQDEDKIFYFQADSDARIIRGLLVIVLAAFNGKTAGQIQNFDIEEYFATLGLMQQLSPSRGNGVLAIVEKIKALTLTE